MIGALTNEMRLQAQLADPHAQMRMAQVQSYDPNTYAVKCLLMPENVESGWLPVASHWVGAGWGLFTPPSPGDWVALQFAEGDIDAGMVVGRLWTGQAPPKAVPSGEFWLMHQSGSSLVFHNDGSVVLNTQAGLTATVGASLTANVGQNANITVSGNVNSSASQWVHQGPMQIKGALTVTQAITGQGGMSISGGSGGAAATINGALAATGDVTAGAVSLQHHVHGGVQGGSSTTGGPQ
jgi:phage baseplate assembly protein V